MQQLIINRTIVEKLQRIEVETRNLVLGHIFDLRINGLAPSVEFESEAIRAIWPDIVSEYVRLDKQTRRKQKSRECDSPVTVTQEVPSSPKEKASPHTPYKEKHTSSPQEYLDQTLFDRWWSVYPRKVGKSAARTKFFALVKKSHEPEQLVEAMIAAVLEQERKLEWSKDRIQFIPHPLTWLNQGRWEDEVVELVRQKRNLPRKPVNYRATKPENLDHVL